MPETETTSRVQIQCVCGARLKGSALVCGTDVQCDVCGQTIHVPDLSETGTIINSVPPDMDMSAWLRYRCPCGKVVKAPSTWAGKSGRCPICHKPFVMPKSQSIQELAGLDVAPGITAANAAVHVAPTAPATPAPDAVATPVPVLKGLSKEELEARTKERLERLKPRLKRTVRLPVSQWTLRDVISFFFELPQRYPTASLGFSAGIAAVAGVMLIFGVKEFNPDVVSRTSLDPVYFYDLSTSKLYKGARDAAAPVEAPSGGKQANGGPAGVRAYVMACGSCSDLKASHIAYLESFNPESQRAWKDYLDKNSKFIIPIPDAEDPSIPGVNAGRMISRTAPVEWVPIFSKQGREILGEAAKPCSDGTAAKQCSP